MNWPLWWWIAPAVLVFWAVGGHNRLVRLRAAVLQSFALLDGHLQRWTALAVMPVAVEPLAAAATYEVATQAIEDAGAALVRESVASHGAPGAKAETGDDAAVTLAGGVESDTPQAPESATTSADGNAVAQHNAQWAGLHAAAVQLQASMAASRQRPLDAANIASLAAARDVLRSAWRRTLAEAPGFAGTPQAGSIHVLWDQHDTQVQLACDHFNDAVLRYNAALSQFPAAILAWILRLTPARTL